MATLQDQTFHSNYADTRLLFKVVEHTGSDVWRCVSSEQYYEGVEIHLSGSEIRRILEFERLLNNSQVDANTWFENLPVGTTLHLVDTDKTLVRVEVVLDENGKKCVKDKAMLGNWRMHDLPSRNRDGSIYLGYHAKNIAEGKLSSPHPGNFLEYPHNSYHYKVNPDELEEMDLTLPEPTEEEEQQYALVRAILEVCEEGNKVMPGTAVETLKTMLQKLHVAAVEWALS